MSAVKTMSIPEAGALYYGLGRAASFKAARRGAFPLIGTGERYRRVSVPAMERLLLEAGKQEDGGKQEAKVEA
jgi:hypothetical protein